MTFISIDPDDVGHNANWDGNEATHITIRGSSFRASHVYIKTKKTVGTDLIIEDCTIHEADVDVGGRLFVKNCHIMDGVKFRCRQQFHLTSNLISARNPIVRAGVIEDFCFFCQNHLWPWDGVSDAAKDAYIILDLDRVDGLNVSNNGFYRRSLSLRGGWVNLNGNMFDSRCNNTFQNCNVHAVGNLYSLDGDNEVTKPFLKIDGGQVNIIGDRCFVSKYGAVPLSINSPDFACIWSGHYAIHPPAGTTVHNCGMKDTFRSW